MGGVEYLTPILERKRIEVERRRRHAAARLQPSAAGASASQLRAASERSASPLAPVGAARAVAALRRAPGELPRVIAEIKRSSPSAGEIRRRERGDVVAIANAYVAGGAAAISVLCDGPGFGGCALDVRRAVRAVSVPILFKEFVLDEVQLDLAQAVGASLALLIVRALPKQRLHALVRAAYARGLAPVVEAANPEELLSALETDAEIVGINARDLGTFKVDKSAAVRALASIPPDRIAIHMSGVHGALDLRDVASGRADAVLIGESLMRAPDPAHKLRELLGLCGL
jgi:indole-3-glycerol phosphate synthase